MRFLDHKKRQDEILDLIIQDYISRPQAVSSEYLKARHNLALSSATLRNIMSDLEELGFISHLHTSSGRVPTVKGFRYYVEILMQDDDERLTETKQHVQALVRQARLYKKTVKDTIEEISRIISQITHCISVWHLSGERVFFTGTHFILEQPEFEDIVLLRHLFFVLEERASALLEFFENKLDKDVKILIGEDIGLDEVSNCALALSRLDLKGMTEKVIIGVLGPVRMNYTSVAITLKTIKKCMEQE